MTDQISAFIGEEADEDLEVSVGFDEFEEPLVVDAFGLLSPTPSTEVQVGTGTNLISNGSFEAPGTGWLAGPGWTFPATHLAPVHGSSVAQLVAVGSSGQGALTTAALIPVSVLLFYWASARTWMTPFSRGSGRMLLHEYDATGVLLRSTVVGETFEADTGWYAFARRFGPRAHESTDIIWHIDTTHVRVAFESADDAVFTWSIDGVMLAEGLDQSAFNPGQSDAINGADIIPGTLPPIAIDTTPPPPPTNLVPGSETEVMSDGSVQTAVAVAFTPAPDEDLAGTEVFITRLFTQSDETDPNTRVPVWTAPQFAYVPIGSGDKAVFSSVLGGSTYWARARSMDRVGNRSGFSGVAILEALRDSDAPPMPAGVATIPGFRGAAVSWLPSLAPDLSHYELRWRPTGDTSDWRSMRTRTTVQFVSDLTPDLSYDFQVRAQDTSGNVVTSATDPRAVQGSANAEAGWSAAITALPTNIGSADIASNAIKANHIEVGAITADKIGAGLIKINTQITTVPDGIQMVDAVLNEIGRWDERGIIIRDPTSTTTRTSRWVEIIAGTDFQGLPVPEGVAIRMTTNGGATYDVGISPDGIDATAIRMGALAGGHNLLANSSFELGGFLDTGVAGQKVWDATADFTGASVGSSINATVTAGGSVTMTGTAF